MMNDNKKTFVIDGQTMKYLDCGQGEVLVFGHSYLWDSAMWAPQIEALSQQYRCIVPDLWAHGESDLAPQTMKSLQDYARHILALMDELNIEKFSVIGLSVGGMWGADLALLAPERVTALALMDTFLGREPEVTHQKYFFMLDTISAVKAVPPPVVDTVVPMFFARNAAEDSPELVAGFRDHLASLSGDRVVDIARIGKMIFGRAERMDDAETLSLPVLIAVGAEDTPRPVLEAHLMHDAIKGSQLVVIPQAGHISSLEQPEMVNHILTDFLAKVYPA